MTVPVKTAGQVLDLFHVAAWPAADREINRCEAGSNEKIGTSREEALLRDVQ
jgi:hypothetical protein